MEKNKKKKKKKKETLRKQKGLPMKSEDLNDNAMSGIALLYDITYNMNIN